MFYIMYTGPIFFHQINTVEPRSLFYSSWLLLESQVEHGALIVLTTHQARRSFHVSFSRFELSQTVKLSSEHIAPKTIFICIVSRHTFNMVTYFTLDRNYREYAQRVNEAKTIDKTGEQPVQIEQL